MNKLKSHLTFTKQQQRGIFFLLALIIILQLLYFFVDIPFHNRGISNQKEWLAFQHQLDSIKQLQLESYKPKRYPFNPNYIDDYKGYALGMSTEEIDRLLNYRNSGKFINSAEEFQTITKITDERLQEIQPYFKFPNWVNAKEHYAENKPKPQAEKTIASHVPKKDINTATAQELTHVKGIGETLSERIIKFRDKLGGFLINEQLYDVYGLPTETAHQIWQHYAILSPPQIQKININTASAKELASIVYIRYKIADAIIDYREKAGRIASLEELTKIQDFPTSKIDRIQLYLKVE